jgi:hypothetical protein
MSFGSLLRRWRRPHFTWKRFAKLAADVKLLALIDGER